LGNIGCIRERKVGRNQAALERGKDGLYRLQ